MSQLLLELLPCLVLGLLMGWRLPWLPAWLAPPLIHWGVPLSLAALLLRSELSSRLIRVGMVGLLAPLLCLVLVLCCTPLRQRIGERVLLLGAAVGNTGYWGLPVALAVLPHQMMATAATFDLAGTFITWSVGPLVLMGDRGTVLRGITAMARSPALRGVLLSALISQTPWRVALAQLLWWPARLTFALALALVGMRLGVTIRDRTLVVCEGLPWALALKLVGVPALVWLLASLVHLSPMERQALVLQGAAPTALSVLLMAEAEQLAAPLASSLVLCSTLLALVTVPLWWVVIR